MDPRVKLKHSHLFLPLVSLESIRHLAGYQRMCQGIPPKILVLVADPRHAFAVWWQTLGQLLGAHCTKLPKRTYIPKPNMQNHEEHLNMSSFCVISCEAEVGT